VRSLHNAHPFIQRLHSVHQSIKTVQNAQTSSQKVKGYQDAAFWAGRTFSDVLNEKQATAGEGNIYYETLGAIFAANEKAVQGSSGDLPVSNHPARVTASLVAGPALIALSSKWSSPLSSIFALGGLACTYWGLSQWKRVGVGNAN
jgi:hypothetical protein